jgi:hypothetical protein
MQQFAKAKFASFALRVPHNWQQPQGDARDHYDLAMRDGERNVAPHPSPMFTPHSGNRYHVDAQMMLVAKFGAFIDGITSAICSAWSTWQSAATITGIMINGPIASLGKVVGPPIGPLIMAQGPHASPAELRYTNVVANVIGNAWQSYTSSITIPGLPIFPLYASFPGPMAPPTPSPVMIPLMALTQVPAPLQPALLKQQMCSQLGDPQAQYHQQLFESIAEGFNQTFTIWQSTTQLNGFIGGGPVPSFAPPVAPVGPVVAGTGLLPPGGLV